MMRTIRFIYAAFAMLSAAATVSAQDGTGTETIVLGREIMPKDTTVQRRFKNHLIAPKGEWQCGISVMYADFSSKNTEYMLLLNGVDAGASMLRLAPEAAYTFADNHAIGAKFQYTNVNGMVDAATADLLGNFEMSVENLHANTRSAGASIFQRTYVGLDNHGRVGIIWDYILGVTRSKSQFYTGDSSDAYSLTKKIHLGFAPGIVYFPMNNVSIQASISLADLSYSNISAYDDGKVVGTRHAWKALASLNLLGLNFGLTVHL